MEVVSRRVDDTKKLPFKTSGGDDSSSSSGDEPGHSTGHLRRHIRHHHHLPPKKYRLKEVVAQAYHNSTTSTTSLTTTSPVLAIRSPPLCSGTSKIIYNPGHFLQNPVTVEDEMLDGKDEDHSGLIDDDDEGSGSSIKDSGNQHSFTSGENSESEMGGYGDAEDVGRQDGEESGRKFFECDVCNMKFSNGANMRRHRMRHTGVKPFECRICQKRFFRKDHLAEHMATHSKLLPFRCPICSKGFQRQIAMRAHFQNEHVGGSHDVVKTCPLCTYKSGSMKSLRIHFYSKHGIDLDNPLPHSPSLLQSSGSSNGGSAGTNPSSPGPFTNSNGEYSELAQALGFEDRGDKSSDSSIIPSHFLVPQIEISANSYPNHYSFNPDSSYDLQELSHRQGICDNSAHVNVSPKSDSGSSSNVPSSSGLIVVKREVLDDDHSSPEETSTSSRGSSVVDTKSKLFLEPEDIQQDTPEDLSSSGNIGNGIRSIVGRLPVSSSVVKVSPLKSLLEDDWKKDGEMSSTSNNRLSKELASGIGIGLHKSVTSRGDNSSPYDVSQVSDGGEVITSSQKSSSSRQRPTISYPDVAIIHQCIYCKIVFPDRTLYFLHKGCHSDSSPWRCNICGEACCNVYDFNSHILSKSHQ